MDRTQSPDVVSQVRDRIREVVNRSKKAKLTALLHRDRRIPLAPGAALEFLERFHGRFRVGRGVDRPQRLG